jgi:hypothetical protein
MIAINVAYIEAVISNDVTSHGKQALAFAVSVFKLFACR